MAELSSGESSDVIRFVREVCDRWDDPAAWREHLLRRACALLGGHIGTMVAECGGAEQDGAFGRLAVIAALGVPDELRAYIQPAVSKFDLRSYEDASSTLLSGM